MYITFGVIYVSIYVSLYLSISLSIYPYIYIYICIYIYPYDMAAYLNTMVYVWCLESIPLWGPQISNL